MFGSQSLLNKRLQGGALGGQWSPPPPSGVKYPPRKDYPRQSGAILCPRSGRPLSLLPVPDRRSRRQPVLRRASFWLAAFGRRRPAGRVGLSQGMKSLPLCQRRTTVVSERPARPVNLPHALIDQVIRSVAISASSRRDGGNDLKKMVNVQF